MTSGYNNRIAVVDLTSREVSNVATDESAVDDFLGGRGLGCALLYKHARSAQPLAEESLLYVGVGPLTGSGFPLANRLTLVFRSPLTGTIAWTNTGGYAGSELKSAGFDALIIKGKSERPVYMLIENSSISLLDGSAFWGKGAIEVVPLLRHVHGDARVLSIGPGGENLVSFATVVNDTGRTSGVRHGAGCVMGSKLLKAVVIRGNAARRIEIADRNAHINMVRRMVSKVRESSLLNHETGLLAVYGTPIAAEFLGKNDAIPVRNYQSTVLERYVDIGGRSMSGSILISRLTCGYCPVGCRRETASTGKYNFRVEGPDYAQISSLGSNCAVTDLESIGYMNYLCYDYGLDPIEMGNELAMLCELNEKRLVSDGLEWGKTEKMVDIIRQTAYRQGAGDILARGPERMAEHFGSPEVSMSVKGITIQNTDPRVEPAWGLANATENFGSADHIWVYADLILSLRDSGVKPLLTSEASFEQIAQAVKFRQDLVALLDSLQVCAFSSYTFTLEDYAEELKNITGIRRTGDDLLAVGQRIFALESKFNSENGFTSSQDKLPARFLEEPVPSGIHRGKLCELKLMLVEYQKLRESSHLGLESVANLPTLF